MRTALFWGITELVVVFPNRRFWTDRLFRNDSKELDSSWNVIAHGDAGWGSEGETGECSG